MLALQLVIGTGVALLFPMLIYYGIATIRQPPKKNQYVIGRPPSSSDASDLEKQSHHERQERENEAWQKAQASYAKTLFTVMTPSASPRFLEAICLASARLAPAF